MTALTETACGTATILNVHYDETRRFSMSCALRAAGFNVVEASTGAGALHIALNIVRPEMILLTLTPSDQDGFKVCPELRSRPSTERIAIVYVSPDSTNDETRAHWMKDGADGYVSEPADPRDLVPTVLSFLRARQAEALAQLATHEWRATFDAITDCVGILSADGRIVRCNESLTTLLGGTDASAVGRPLHVAMNISQDELPSLGELVRTRARQTREFVAGGLCLRMSLDPIVNGDAHIIGCVCVISDLTHCRQLERDLVQRAADLVDADRRKNEFLAMLAHELRNPLAAASAAVDLMEDRNLDLRQQSPGFSAAASEATVTVVKRHVSHLVRMVDDLLDVARITRGKIALRNETLDVTQVLRNAIETCQVDFQGRQHTLRIRMPDAPVRVIGDNTRLEQVITNLLENAAKYTPPAGVIDVVLDTVADESCPRAVLRVIDNGIGIDLDRLPHVFDLFVQIDSSLDRARGGLGIGLTLVKRLIEMHGGMIRVKSSGVGLGTEFTVELPLVDSPPAYISMTQAAAAPQEEESVPLRILIVEDNEDLRAMMRRKLERSGHEVHEAADGVAGVATARAAHPDLALIDVGLPGMNGYEVARTLRREPNLAAMRLAAITGYGGESHRTLAREAGFDAHLVKPVTLEQLTAVASRVHRP